MAHRTLSIETRTHGRVLVRDATEAPARGALIACHGYGQSADWMLEQLSATPGLSGWTIVAVQGLHRFYTRGDAAVIASWMTRQDRDQAIADNVAYLDRVVGEVLPARPAIVYVGFSQGAAMAYRAALLGSARPVGVVALAGDIPPELDAAGCPPVLIGAGRRDTWYTGGRLAADRARLQAAGVPHELVEFDGGHEWTAEFGTAVARWLSRR